MRVRLTESMACVPPPLPCSVRRAAGAGLADRQCAAPRSHHHEPGRCGQFSLIKQNKAAAACLRSLLPSHPAWEAWLTGRPWIVAHTHTCSLPAGPARPAACAATLRTAASRSVGQAQLSCDCTQPRSPLNNLECLPALCCIPCRRGAAAAGRGGAGGDPGGHPRGGGSR